MTKRQIGVLLLSTLIACGGDSNTTKQPDANNQPPPDAGRSCTTVTPGTIDILNVDASNMFVSWGGDVTGDLGDGNKLIYQLEFYGGVEPSLMGTFDLHTGNQTNYKTCAICVRAFAVDAQNKVQKRFFQSGGSVTLSEDPTSNNHLVASISNLQLEEVTIAMDFTSTPVPNGACATLGTYTLDHDRVPNAWTCSHATYEDGTNCNCMCGLADPDCAADKPTMGCSTAGNVCFNDACVAPPANDTCTTAGVIATPTNATGTTVSGSTAGGHHDYDKGLETMACTGFSQPGPDVAYSVALTAATSYTFTLSGLATGVDLSLALVGPGASTVCSSNITTCVKGADAGLNGANETFTFTPTQTGTYFVIVDSYDPNVGGAFSLNVKTP